MNLPCWFISPTRQRCQRNISPGVGLEPQQTNHPDSHQLSVKLEKRGNCLFKPCWLCLFETHKLKKIWSEGKGHSKGFLILTSVYLSGIFHSPIYPVYHQDPPKWPILIALVFKGRINESTSTETESPRHNYFKSLEIHLLSWEKEPTAAKRLLWIPETWQA